MCYSRRRKLYFDRWVMESEQTNNIVMSDFPPEYCHYRDEGCEFADSCLSCPLPKCIYDEPGGKQRWLKRLRDRKIVRLFSTEGRGVKELALMFGLSERTVQRALKNSLPTQSLAKGKIKSQREKLERAVNE